MSSIEEIKNRIKNQTGLVMSRVPEPTRSEFIEFANGEFAGDYGLSLKWYVEQAKEYQKVKKVLLNEEILKEILK
jgi:hypothetical protein